jgi:hypothetical protein
MMSDFTALVKGGRLSEKVRLGGMGELRDRALPQYRSLAILSGG